MLREITAVRQNSSEQQRRWFTDADMDLFVWFCDQVPTGFELSYGKGGVEHSMSWKRDIGFSHHYVDDGENRPGRYKMTPIMLDHPEPNIRQIARNFLAASEALDPALADFIYARLLEHPGLRRGRSDQDNLSTN
jgi:hypothetical protein